MIAEGLAVNGLTYLAQAAGKRFWTQISLPFRMRREMKPKGSDPFVASYLDALQRAFGAEGKLTAQANDALIDIASSSLLEHLLVISQSEIDPINATALIQYIHQSHNVDYPDTSTPFADDLLSCLRTAAAEIPTKAEIVSTLTTANIHQKLVNDQARRSEAAIGVALQKLRDKNGNWIEDADFSAREVADRIAVQLDPLCSYADVVTKTLNVVDVHGASGDVVQVPLDEIYVDTPIQHISREANFNHYADLRRNMARVPIASDWQEAREFFSKAVLLGDPGGGKSTLSKKLCIEAARSFLDGKGSLPVFAQLRSYISHAVEDERLSLTHYVIDLIVESVIDADNDDLRSIVLYYLRIGRMFVVFDGLDEVLTAANRHRVVKEITDFAKQFPLCEILVTSRFVGYETQPVPGFSHFEVSSIDDAAADQIFRNVSRSVLKRTSEEIDAQLPGFKADCRRKAAELIGSPLLLTLIVIIYNKKSEIPDNRASLYSFCAELLFERWDSYRAIEPQLPERYRLHDLLKYIAFLLYEHEEFGGQINRDNLEERARTFFRDDYIDNKEGRSAEAARLLVDHLTGRSWILHEIGEHLFEFTHRTFLEYFYAKWLEARHEETKILVSENIEHIAHGRRTLPLHLALQIRSKDKRTTSSMISEELSAAAEYHGSLDDFIEFCVDSLEYLLPSAESLTRFVRAIAPRALSSSKPAIPIKLLGTKSPLRPLVIREIETHLGHLLSVPDVLRLAPALVRWRMRLTDLHELGAEDELDALRRYLDKTYFQQTRSPFITKIAFDLDSQVNWSMVEKYGLRLWTNKHYRHLWGTRATIDSRRMLGETFRFIEDRSYEGDKYLDLARIIHRTCLSQELDATIDPLYLRDRDYNRVHDAVDVICDAGRWREDREATEMCAFSLAFFLENHFDLLKKSDLRRCKRAYVNLTDALEALGSDSTEWHHRWIKGKISIFANSRYDTRRMQHFISA